MPRRSNSVPRRFFTRKPTRWNPPGSPGLPPLLRSIPISAVESVERRAGSSGIAPSCAALGDSPHHHSRLCQLCGAISLVQLFSLWFRFWNWFSSLKDVQCDVMWCKLNPSSLLGCGRGRKPCGGFVWKGSWFLAWSEQRIRECYGESGIHFCCAIRVRVSSVFQEHNVGQKLRSSSMLACVNVPWLILLCKLVRSQLASQASSRAAATGLQSHWFTFFHLVETKPIHP